MYQAIISSLLGRYLLPPHHSWVLIRDSVADLLHGLLGVLLARIVIIQWARHEGLQILEALLLLLLSNSGVFGSNEGIVGLVLLGDVQAEADVAALPFQSLQQAKETDGVLLDHRGQGVEHCGELHIAQLAVTRDPHGKGHVLPLVLVASLTRDVLLAPVEPLDWSLHQHEVLEGLPLALHILLEAGLVSQDAILWEGLHHALRDQVLLGDDALAPSCLRNLFIWERVRLLALCIEHEITDPEEVLELVCLSLAPHLVDPL